MSLMLSKNLINKINATKPDLRLIKKIEFLSKKLRPSKPHIAQIPHIMTSPLLYITGANYIYLSNRHAI